MDNVIHPENERGRDFFVGDVHGCFAELMSELEKRAFDPASDRLFACGDLIDRGPQSLACLRLIQEDWFFSVLGNHEEMLVDVLRSDEATAPFARRLHEQNGGGWAANLSAEERTECQQLIESLPHCRTVPFGGKAIGVIHAGWRWQWGEFERLDMLESIQKEYATWARLDAYGILDVVPGIDAVVSGHQNTAEVTTRGNQVWIDTIGVTGQLTVLKAQQILDRVQEAD